MLSVEIIRDIFPYIQCNKKVWYAYIRISFIFVLNLYTIIRDVKILFMY